MMKPLVLFSILMLTQTAIAQDGHRHHDAHVHGQAKLNLVISGQQLLVELETPANNLLGFEHQAKTEKDKKILRQAVAVLNKPAQWLQPDTAAGCQLQDIQIESALLNSVDDDEHHEHEGHKEHAKHDDHDDHEDHEKHAKHDDHDKHEHEDHDKHGHDDHDYDKDEVHSEFDISLSYTCARPERLSSVDVSGLFQRFSKMQEIDVQWITERKQSATELSGDRGIISLQ